MLKSSEKAGAGVWEDVAVVDDVDSSGMRVGAVTTN
jgi:hypothetical protein